MEFCAGCAEQEIAEKRAGNVLLRAAIFFSCRRLLWFAGRVRGWTLDALQKPYHFPRTVKRASGPSGLKRSLYWNLEILYHKHE